MVLARSPRRCSTTTGLVQRKGNDFSRSSKARSSNVRRFFNASRCSAAVGDWVLLQPHQLVEFLPQGRGAVGLVQ